jgi:hypothetical protein
VSTLRALVLSCSLTPSPAESSSELLGREVLAALVDHDVKVGVEVDMGDGDAWPAIRRKVLDSDSCGSGPTRRSEPAARRPGR